VYRRRGSSQRTKTSRFDRFRSPPLSSFRFPPLSKLSLSTAFQAFAFQAFAFQAFHRFPSFPPLSKLSKLSTTLAGRKYLDLGESLPKFSSSFSFHEHWNGGASIAEPPDSSFWVPACKGGSGFLEGG
jgi:hypothetical protein